MVARIMDDDLHHMSREQLAAEVAKLRAGIRDHRDSAGHELCWHHPKLWGLLPERTDPQPVVPTWPEFLRGCLRYRQSLDEQLPNAPRSSEPYRDGQRGGARYTVDVPRLTTDRLVLRAFEEDRDFDAFAAMMADPEVTRHLGSGVLQRMEAWRFFALFIGHWVLRGFGLWAVEERATGTFIGRIGFLEPEGWPGFELAYTLARPAWNRGYAREAGAAALAYARNTLKRDRIISIIRPDNKASIRVAESLGAAPGETIDFFGGKSVVYVYGSGE